MNVLIVEDELVLRENLQLQLADAGFNVEVAADGDQGLVAGLISPAPDVAIVDLGLPKRPGLAVIRELRARKRGFPILVLTASSGWKDKVEGLQAGADDYVCKPVHFAELLARLLGLVRRANGWATPELAIGPFALNTRTQTLTVSGASVDLTSYEYRLLERLMLRAGRVVSIADLSEHVYQAETESESNVIVQLIARLRRKLDPSETLLPIETVYGEGYRFASATGRGKSISD